MSDTEILEAVVQKIRSAPPAPDDDWINELAELIFRCPLSVHEPQVLVGPDRNPYFAMRLPQEADSSPLATLEQVFDYLLTNHLGFVLLLPNGQWSMAHGQILSWRMYKKPNAPRCWNAPKGVPGKETLTEPETIWVGAPNEEMLPPPVRDMLRTVMQRRLGIAEPRVGLVRRSSEPHYASVVFDLDEAKLGGEQAAFAAYRMLVWYMPYCIPSLHMPTLAGSPWMVPL